MTNYTPGPWTADEIRHDYDQVIRNKDRDPVALVLLGGYSPVCGKANARLIAAAPDLLMAVNRFVDYYKSCPGRLGNGQARKSLDEFEVAIAKAEGKS